ncbi:AAA family ATPase [Myxococcota bacterium]|nr:AAA family ATPase [Myxococcota bacterium]
MSDTLKTCIESLRLKNFRCFEDLALNLHPELTVLVSANGQGKSSILDAIRIVLGPFFRPFAQERSVGFVGEDIRQARFPNSMEHQFPVEVSAQGQIVGKSLNWQRFLRTIKSHTTVKEAQPLIHLSEDLKRRVEGNEPVILPLFANYGSQRLWLEKRTRQSILIKNLDESRFAGYQYTWQPDSSSIYFLTWFRFATVLNEKVLLKMLKAGLLENNSVGQATSEQGPYSGELFQIRKAMNECLELTGWNNLEFTPDDQMILHHEKHGALELNQLSDGIRIVAMLAGDLAYRAVRLNPHLAQRILEETPGIVMIDEIELHLHPAWQQVVIPSLRKVFPKIQFIITTHSPQVLSSVPAESIRILDDQRVYSPEIGTRGAEASRILQRVFEVENRPPHESPVMDLKAYADLVFHDQWDSPEALELRSKLDQAFKDDEPELQRLDLFIRNRKWELES